MSATTIIRQGEDLEFVFDLGGDDITGWICRMGVKETLDSPVLTTRIIPPSSSGNEWPSALNSDDTELYNVGHHLLIGLLVNLSTDQQRQIKKRFHVSQAVL